MRKSRENRALSIVSSLCLKPPIRWWMGPGNISSALRPFLLSVPASLYQQNGSHVLSCPLQCPAPLPLLLCQAASFVEFVFISLFKFPLLKLYRLFYIITNQPRKNVLWILCSSTEYNFALNGRSKISMYLFIFVYIFVSIFLYVFMYTY